MFSASVFKNILASKTTLRGSLASNRRDKATVSASWSKQNLKCYEIKNQIIICLNVPLVQCFGSGRNDCVASLSWAKQIYIFKIFMGWVNLYILIDFLGLIPFLITLFSFNMALFLVLLFRWIENSSIHQSTNPSNTDEYVAALLLTPFMNWTLWRKEYPAIYLGSRIPIK